MLMSSYEKTVNQWRKTHPPKTREEIEREVKEKATRQLYRESDEYYLDPNKKEHKELFKNWPTNELSSSISLDDYARSMKGQMEKYSDNQTGFFKTIIDKRGNYKK